MHPFGLSYYNALVGGLPGAERLGLELTYWSDAIDNVLLDRLARDGAAGDSAAMAPTLYPGQGKLTTGFNRTLARRGDHPPGRGGGDASRVAGPLAPHRLLAARAGGPPAQAAEAGWSRPGLDKESCCPHSGISPRGRRNLSTIDRPGSGTRRLPP